MERLIRLFVFIILVAVFVGRVGFASAQYEDCYEDGEFGPTCAAVAAPTVAPTSVPKGGPLPTNPPTPTMPVSGSAGAVSAVIFGGTAFLLLGLGFVFVRR